MFPVSSQSCHSGLDTSRLVSGRLFYINNFGNSTELVRTYVLLTVPTKKSFEWYCLLSLSGKSLKIRYYSRLSRVILSSPAQSRFFHGFFLTMGPETSSPVTVPPIREVIASLVLSRSKRARECRPLNYGSRNSG